MISEGEYETHPWRKIFAWSASPYYGYVYDLESAQDIIDEFEYYTHSSYVSTRCTRSFGRSSINGTYQ